MISASVRLGQQSAAVDAAAGRWRGLFLAGAWAALGSVLLVVLAIVAHVVWTPPAWAPGAAGAWFARFNESWLLGLLGLDLLIIFGLVLGLPLFLALYVALRTAGESTMALVTVAALVSTVLHLTSNTAFEMLALSQGYAAAAGEAQRAALLAAGEAALAAYYGSAFHVSYVLGYLAKLAIGVVMLRVPAFGRATAWLGITAGVVGLGNYLPAIGLLLSILSVVLIAVWHAFIARTLFRLARQGRF
ncbi:MAG: hypothetical protein ACYC4L_07305 [Chloroflexota bacterium]